MFKFKVNQYFDGNVMSFGITESRGPATVGVMKAGEYEFGTSAREEMTLIAGEWQVKLPGTDVWVDYAVGQTYEVVANAKFGVKALVECAYLCRYDA